MTSARARVGRTLVRLPRSVLAAMLVVRLVDESSYFQVPGTFESIRADLGLTYSQASMSFLAVAIGAVAGAGSSVLADYRSRRVIAAAGALGYAASLLLIGLAPGFAAFLAGSFVLGVASTAMVDATEIAMADHSGDRLERDLSTQNIFGSIGDALGPAIVVAVLGLGWSWRVCFYVSAGLAALYALWLASLRFPPPHVRDEEETVRDQLWSVLRDPAVWLAGLVGTLLGPLDEPLVAFLIAHLEDARGLAASSATLIAGLMVAGDLIGYATLRRWEGVLAVDGALLAASTTLIVLAPDALTATLCSIAIGVFLARFWVNLQARSLRLRPGQAGTVSAVTTVIDLAGWTLPLLAGVIADRLDVTAGLWTFVVIAWALALAALAFTRATRNR